MKKLLFSATVLVAMTALLTMMYSSHATVMQMDEFYNPELNQTLILMHDFHVNLSVADNHQIEDFIQAIGNMKATLITESDMAKEGPLMLDALANTCQKKEMAVASVEFRFCYVKYITIMINIMDLCRTNDQLTEELKKPHVAVGLGKLFFCCNDENHTQCKIIASYVRTIHSLKENSKTNQLYIKQFDSILTETNSIGNIIRAFIYGGKEQFITDENSLRDLSNRVVDDLFIKEGDGSYLLNTRSIYFHMQSLSSSLLDANLLKELHQERNKRVVFLHAGGRHLGTLADKYLPAIGFEKKHSLSHTNKFKEMFESEMKTSRNLHTTLQSEKFEEYAVDVELFLKQCKTISFEVTC